VAVSRAADIDLLQFLTGLIAAFQTSLPQVAAEGLR
jgi:hypothetical protein